MSSNDPGKLLLHALVESDGDRYSALCLELDVASEGETPEQALANLREAVAGYLETVFQHGLEDELFPRLAPQSEWRKFFQAQVRVRSDKIADSVELHEVAYA